MNSQFFVRSFLPYFDLFLMSISDRIENGENVSNPILFKKKKKKKFILMQKPPQVPSAQAFIRRSTLDKQHAILCVDAELHWSCIAADTNTVCYCRLPWKVAWIL